MCSKAIKVFLDCHTRNGISNHTCAKAVMSRREVWMSKEQDKNYIYVYEGADEQVVRIDSHMCMYA